MPSKEVVSGSKVVRTVGRGVSSTSGVDPNPREPARRTPVVVRQRRPSDEDINEEEERPITPPVQVVVENIQRAPSPPVDPPVMAYANYDSTDAAILEFASWYEVGPLLRKLHSIRKKNFAYMEERQAALAELNELVCLAPFSANQRFPEHKFYVCEARGAYIRRFQQLRTSLVFKDPTKDPKAKNGGSGNHAVNASTSGQLTEVEQIGDSVLAFHNSITSIISAISQKESVYNRASFEVTFGLNWAQAGP